MLRIIEKKTLKVMQCATLRLGLRVGKIDVTFLISYAISNVALINSLIAQRLILTLAPDSGLFVK